MTLEEAIIHSKEKACGNTQCALEHRQLAEWLKELQSLRRYSSNTETIEERAKEVGRLSQYKSDYPYDKKSVEFGYMKGATERKAIDIYKACEWLHARNVLTEASIEGFRKAMEE